MGIVSNMLMALAILYFLVVQNHAAEREIQLETLPKLLNFKEIEDKVSDWLPQDNVQLMRMKRAHCCGHLRDEASKPMEKAPESKYEDMKVSEQRLARHVEGVIVPSFQDAKGPMDVKSKADEASITTS